MAINRVLQSSVQNGLPKFDGVWDGTSAVGSMEPISAITLSGTQSSIEFNNIPQTYTHLQVRGIVMTNNLVDIGCRFGNNSIDSGSNYAKHGVYASSAVASSAYTSQTYFNVYGYVSGTTNNYPMAFILDILDYANTNKYKIGKSFAGMDKNANYGEIGLYSGLWIPSGGISVTINTISLLAPGDNFIANSSFSLYGVK